MNIKLLTSKQFYNFVLSPLQFTCKWGFLILCIYFMLSDDAYALIGRVKLEEFVWYHYAIVGAFILGLIFPPTRSVTLSIVIALIALYAVIEMLVAFDFVSDEWPRAED